MCEQWKSGSDCTFDEWSFYLAWAIIWTTTACLLAGTMMRSRSLTGRSRHCLALAALAAFLCAVDCAIPIVSDRQPKIASSSYPLSYLGTIPLAFALHKFADRWREVAAYLWRKKEGGGDASSSFITTTLALISSGYKYMAIVHIPFAVLRFSSHLTEGVYLSISIVWSAWLFVSACCTLTVLSMLMCIVAKSLSDVPHSKGLRTVSMVNLCEQIMFNVCFLCIGLLMWVDNLHLTSGTSGNMVGACKILTYIVFWLMHAQVAFFFMTISVSDPMYSGEEFRNLVSMDSKQILGKASVKEDEQDPSPSTIGSPSQEKDYSPTPSQEEDVHLEIVERGEAQNLTLL